MSKTRTTVLSISMLLIIIGMMLLPAAMGAENISDYTVTVTGTQNTALTETNVTFGDLTAGSSDNEITGSFSLNNTGNAVAIVSATFTTNVSTIYGLTNTSAYVIDGANFSMINTDGGTYTSLDNTASDTELTNNNVAADAIADVWNVKLDVPSGQTTAIYTGTVQVTFA